MQVTSRLKWVHRLSRFSRFGLGLLLGLVSGAAVAQDIPTSSPNIVGSGARALGMGSAFIAVADDATAASWNPAGLTQLESPEFSLVLSLKRFEERIDDTHFLDASGDFHVTLEDINYASFVYPFRRTLAGRNFVASINYQQQFDFGRTLDLERRSTILSGGRINRFVQSVEYTQAGTLSSLSPAFAFELTNRLSVGAAVNLWNSDFNPESGWETHTKARSRFNRLGGPLGNFTRSDVRETFDNVRGHNYTFGLLYRPVEGLTLGAVYHTRFTAYVNNRTITRRFVPPSPLSTRRTTLRFEFPSAIGVGAAYRFPNDKLTISFDVTRREWDQYVKIDPRGGLLSHRVSPITNEPKSRAAHDATYTIRLGGEYVFVNKEKPYQQYLPSIRAGVFYDPEPASGKKDTLFGITGGDGDPDDFYGVALGAGVLIANRVNIDLAYQFRWGNDVRSDLLRGALTPGPFSILSSDDFGIDVRQHQLYLSTVIYFNPPGTRGDTQF